MSFTSMLNGARNPYALSLSDIAMHLKDKCSWYCIQISRLRKCWNYSTYLRSWFWMY